MHCGSKGVKKEAAQTLLVGTEIGLNSTEGKLATSIKISNAHSQMPSNPTSGWLSYK